MKKRAVDQPPVDSLEHCADAVEQVIAAGGIELTMGGEPTYVPRRPDGAEWSVDALGPTKLGFARRLAARVMRRRLPGAVLLETSGKHYPGEPIPRWCLQVQWRSEPDAPSLWRDANLLCLADVAIARFDRKDARALIKAIAAAVGNPAHVITADEPEGADREAAGGFVLPLDELDGAWSTEQWPVPKRKVTLLYGDSWAGLRLPLSSLPEKTLRRALVVEVRAGGLVVFVPPLGFDAYVRLLRVIEDAVAHLQLGPIVLAGYPPPGEGRIRTLGFSSDPGVLEVNLPACATWAEYREWLERMDRAARAVGLCAHKFRYNGQMTGTGGGAHLCFGGPQAARSPFFERPKLLPSLLRYWQHHPALSYAFSGLYLGPGSQAPRVDESQASILDELELACRGAEAASAPINAFELNHMFRDLLVDRGGNTHRAEICIDKMWNQGPGHARAGLVEFRAFEMFPDVDDVARIALLVRAVVARLLARPYARPLRAWGAELHDRYFLPTLLWEDIEVIAADLRKAGIPFDAEWLGPAWDFRFPLVGRLSTKRGDVEVRQALEAWPVLSEQPLASATARSVDSSMDRLEICVRREAMVRSGVLLVNGQPVPLQASGASWLAGVRFRAFYLSAGLHPHIPAQTPLKFEWVDEKSGRVLAAAHWHTWNPRGRHYRGLPAGEAEARRRCAARWEPIEPAQEKIPVTRLKLPRARGRPAFTTDMRHCLTPPPAK